MISNKNLLKTCPRFFCNFCDYGTSKKSSYDEHVLTSKHQKSMISNKNLLKTCSELICEKCNKTYKDSSGLWRHKKKCISENKNTKIEENIENNEHIITPELIINIIQQNQEFKDLLIEQNKQNYELQKQMLEISKNNNNNTTNINNLNNNNSNNKTFNLQVFLNETCKDAMNIMDFVDSIKISLSDIESIGELGFVNGMSKLIIKNLNALDENMRPVHCNDLKRISLFVKDANVWTKEDDNNNKLKKAIRYIAHKNICALPEWRKKYPDCIYSESKKSDQYNHIVIEAMGGSGDNDDEKADKIISKIAKTITIDKKN
jgi:hypothetical protein